MYLVAIAWLYVALMMAVAEAVHSQGSVLGAVVTFLLYGLGPVALAMYLLGTPARRSARRRAEAAAQSEHAAETGSASNPNVTDAESVTAGALLRNGCHDSDGERVSAGLDPDSSGHAPAVAVPGPVASVREEP